MRSPPREVGRAVVAGELRSGSTSGASGEVGFGDAAADMAGGQEIGRSKSESSCQVRQSSAFRPGLTSLGDYTSRSLNSFF